MVALGVANTLDIFEVNSPKNRIQLNAVFAHIFQNIVPDTNPCNCSAIQ